MMTSDSVICICICTIGFVIQHSLNFKEAESSETLFALYGLYAKLLQRVFLHKNFEIKIVIELLTFCSYVLVTYWLQSNTKHGILSFIIMMQSFQYWLGQLMKQAIVSDFIFKWTSKLLNLIPTNIFLENIQITRQVWETYMPLMQNSKR